RERHDGTVRRFLLHDLRHQRQRAALNALAGHDQRRVCSNRIHAPPHEVPEHVRWRGEQHERRAIERRLEPVVCADPGRQHGPGKKSRIGVSRVDCFDHIRLEGPEGDLVPVARKEIGERRAPRTGTNDGALHHAGGEPRRNRCSSPRSSRPMLARWVQNTKSATSTLSASTGARRPIRIAIDSGRRTAATSEASDTYPERYTVAAHATSEISVGIVASARKTPPAVATPLPPAFHRRNGERTCPRMATMPNASAHCAGAGLAIPRGRSHTGKAPLAVSNSSTASPAFQPSTRNTLVAPRLPEPCSRRSMPRTQRPAR